MSLISILKKKNKKTLFTTPSHAGKFYIFHKFYQWYRADISEIDALNPTEALTKAEKRASKIYNTKSTHFLTNGSTSGIIAATLACCKKNDKILIWEKAHRCHKNAAILAGAEIIEYSYPYNEKWDIYEGIKDNSIYALKNLIKKHTPKALIITSPTYEGSISDIKTITKICKENQVYLIVDEAHGALYPFSEDLPETSIQYADFTIQSLHKTAGGINPTALLHCNCEINPQEALDKISTTSPSYPMLATIEANIKYLNSQRGRNAIKNLIKEIRQTLDNLNNIDFYGDDITKILIKKDNISGEKISDYLFNTHQIEDEKTTKHSTLLLCGLGTTKQMLKKLKKALNKLNTKETFD